MSKNSNIPPLSPFPQFTLDVAKISCDFDLSVKPRVPVSDAPLRHLTFTPNDHMRQMRDALERDFAEFSERIKKLGVNEPLKMDALTFPEHDELGQRAQKRQPQPDPPKRRKVESRRAEAPKDPPPESNELPGFSVESRFLMPDGSQFGTD
jgi:hypothetical protein